MSEKTEKTDKLDKPKAREKNSPSKTPSSPRSNGYFSLRKLGFLLGFFAILFLLLSAVALVLFRVGAVDSYVKEQFVEAFDEMGMVFEAEKFELSLAPLQLQLENVTFNNKTTDEKLLDLKNAKFDMTVLDLYEFKTERNVHIDATEIDGLEVWINFDKDGRTNFQGVEILPPKKAVKFQVASTKLSLQNGIVHIGDIQRKISGNAKNIVFSLEPDTVDARNDEDRYKFDLALTDSNFIYDKSEVKPIDIRAKGIVDQNGADLTEIVIKSSVGSSTLSGRIENWQRLKYDLKIESKVDLAKTSDVFPVGTALRGFGNFEGTIKGEGEKYKIDGEITSQNLAAANIRLKALKVNAAIDGRNTLYNGHGKAIAELLTFEDFIIDYPQLAGNIRGNGTDFKWFGELRAAAAKTSFGTLAGLYIADADAEYRDQKLNANFRDFRAKNFASAGADITSLQVNGAKITSENGVTNATVPDANAATINVKGATLQGVNVRNAKITNRDSKTDVDAGDVRIDKISNDYTQLTNVTAKNVIVRNRNGVTEATAAEVQSESVEAGGAKIGNINASGVDVNIVGGETKVYSNNVKIAKIQTDSAVLGSLNVAGVRFTVRDGRIEGTSNDFDVGTVELPDNGNLENVKIKKPVFILEPSGRYRASLDMSLGGGILGKVKLGSARAAVVVDNDQIALSDLSATVMDGKIEGNASIASNQKTRSTLKVDFTDLDLSKLLALQGGKVIPIQGKTTGRADLNFYGKDFKRSSGTLTADINANAGSQDRGLIPLTGKIGVNATDGLFDIDYANLNTAKSQINASGKFDLNGENSKLKLAVNSTDASEIDRIFRVMNLSDSLERQFDFYQAEFTGNFGFNGTVSGNVSDPHVVGNANIDLVNLRGRDLGSVTSQINLSPTRLEFRDGVLQELDGGKLTFYVDAPRYSNNNITVKAQLEKIDLGSVLSALAIKSLPDSLRDLKAETSGDLNLSGLPNEMQGEANLVAKNGSLKGQSFDILETKIAFRATLVDVEEFEAKFGNGYLKAKGTYQTNSSAFDFAADGKDVPVSRILAFFPANTSMPEIEGKINVIATASGNSSNTASYNINFNGEGRNVVVNQSSFGNVKFDGKTENQLLKANLTTKFRGQDQSIIANVNFADPSVPFTAQTKFDRSRLDPYIAIIRKPEPDSIELSGVATGGMFLKGNLTSLDSDGKRVFTTELVEGNAQFSQFDLQIGDTPLNAVEPIDIRFNMNEGSISAAKFEGGGSNLVVSGTKAFRDTGTNNLALAGKINLRILNALSKNVFFSGLSDISMRLTGRNENSRLNGVAGVENASASTFIGSERVTLERLEGSVIFTTNQVQIRRLRGFLGGGKIVASGGAQLKSLQLDRYRLELQGTNITARLPKDFITTGNTEVQINARRIDGELDTLISGTFYAKRSVYNKDIDLADLISGRRETSLSQSSSGTSVIGVPKLDIRVLGRNALVVRNNLADLTATTDLRVTGDVEFPQISGRITANSGTIFFRKDRYDVQRGVLTFSPNSAGFEPVINLQAESQISGYQVFVNLNGELASSDSLVASVRSNPSLPQPDVVSLITTGSLANTGNGIPTYAQSGINTAAEILADEIINKPIARATDKLFGLNKFALDPIISGERRNPTARLTVGRQINRNLLVTYSTNLSEDQNQVLALEYQVSNRLSFVAQYEQRSLTNVTNNRNNFAFEIRLRKRF